MGTLENADACAAASRRRNGGAIFRQARLSAGSAAGWRDLWHKPLPSLVYGFAVLLDLDRTLSGGCSPSSSTTSCFRQLPASWWSGRWSRSASTRRAATSRKAAPVSLCPHDLRARRPRARQVWYTGAILCLLMLVWMRAAVHHLCPVLRPEAVPRPRPCHPPCCRARLSGWAMLVVGTVVGGLFAAFSFAISTFAIPMLLAERTDAFTAMGTSISLVWNNLAGDARHGARSCSALVPGLPSRRRFIGLIVVFPLLGHATWHSYRAIR